MLLFNELMVTVYLYVLISLTDYNDDADLFENCGIALLTVVLFSFTVNFIKFLYFILREIYLKLKKYCSEKSSSDATVAIKPSQSKGVEGDYSSDVTIEGYDMMNRPIKRGPDIQKSNLKLVNTAANIKSLATETRDFQSKSYYDEHEGSASNNNSKYPSQAY